MNILIFMEVQVAIMGA